MDIIKVADHIIDIGPEAGDKGGKITAEGTPEQFTRTNNNHTAKYLKEELT